MKDTSAKISQIPNTCARAASIAQKELGKGVKNAQHYCVRLGLDLRGAVDEGREKRMIC